MNNIKMYSRKMSTGKADPDSSWTAINCEQKKRIIIIIIRPKYLCVEYVYDVYNTWRLKDYHIEWDR